MWSGTAVESQSLWGKNFILFCIILLVRDLSMQLQSAYVHYTQYLPTLLKGLKQRRLFDSYMWLQMSWLVKKSSFFLQRMLRNVTFISKFNFMAPQKIKILNKLLEKIWLNFAIVIICIWYKKKNSKDNGKKKNHSYNSEFCINQLRSLLWVLFLIPLLFQFILMGFLGCFHKDILCSLICYCRPH